MIPLHVHSNNTFLQGTIALDKIIQRAGEYKLPALALTDTNSMHGIIQFSKLANEKKIKPIIGCVIDNPENTNEYIVLLAKNIDGYSDICKIITSRKLNDDFSLSNLLENKLHNLFIITPSIELIRNAEVRENFFVELIASKNEKTKNRKRYEFAVEKGIKYVIESPLHP